MTDDLPFPWFRGRWTPLRKAAVVDAVLKGNLNRIVACRWYGLTPEELESWLRLYATHGVAALRTTRLQSYQGARPPKKRVGRPPKRI